MATYHSDRAKTKLSATGSDFQRGVPMVREQVSSSNLASVGYDPVAQILEIEFHNGGIYQYSGVPAAIYKGLMTASSHGSYFDQFIKKGGYGYRRVR